jgi:oxygen-independent coproporphyrinogen III oxidase
MDIDEIHAEAVHYHPSFEAAKVPAGREFRSGEPIALYVNIPFCPVRCQFCTIASVTGKDVKSALVESYLAAVKKEMAFYAGALRERRVPIETIQIGGGTPTLLGAAQLDALLAFIFATFDCSAVREIIVEAFPTTVTKEKIRILAQVDRLKLNIGVQTFNEDHLREVGRRHSLSDAIDALRSARESDIQSVGVDIIFGLPRSSSRDVIDDLNRVAELGADHVAFYPLWVYEDTDVDRRIRAGALSRPRLDDLRDQLSTGIELLASSGYERYTAFHYATADAHRHGYGMWQMRAKDWIGFGMAAMSYLNGETFLNDRDIGSYIAKINDGIMETGSGQRFSGDAEKRFALLYGLRLRRYPTAWFRERFGCELLDVFDDQLRFLSDRGLVTYDERHVDLTLEGILKLGGIEAYINHASETVLLDDRP